ncbi:hypothetical protein [Mycobacterium sp. NPDC004974]
MITEQAVAGHTTADLDRIAAEILAAYGAASPTAPPATSTTPTAGRREAPPAPAPRTVNTPWPSPPTVPEF